VANLTLAIDDQVLKRARRRALEEDTSVNAVVRGTLERYAGLGEKDDDPIARVLARARNRNSGSGPEGRTWTREDLYEERLGRYGRR
jgi:hypothetical protein